MKPWEQDYDTESAPPWEADYESGPANIGPDGYPIDAAQYELMKRTGQYVEPSPLTAMRQGQTFGFADELAGFGSAVGSKIAGSDKPFSELYANRRDAERLAAKTYAEQNPGWSMALAATSGILAPMPIKMAPAGTMLGRTGQAARFGAGYGAVAGLGAGEGGILDQALSTGGGAIIGGLLGPVVNVAGEGVAAIPGAARAITGRNKVAIPGSAIAPVEQRLAPGAMPLPAVTPVADVSVPASESGKRALLNAMIADGIPPERAREIIAARALSTATASTKPATLADIAPTGGATQRLVRGSRSVSPAAGGRADQFLTGRDRMQSERMISDFDVSSGIPDVPPTVMQREMTQEARTAAKPFYEQSRAAGEVNIAGLEPFVNTSYFQQARAHIENIPKLRAKNVNDAEVLDEMYKFLGGMREKRELGYSEKEAVGGLMNAIKGSIDDATGGAYSKATSAYAGGMVGSDALESGAKVFNKSAATVKDELAQLGDREKAVYRTAAADSIREKLRNLGYNRDAVKAVFNNDSVIEKMRAVFGSNEAFRNFEREIIAEAEMTGTKNVVMGNSQTVDKAVDAMNAGGYTEMLANAVLDPGQAVASAARSGVGGILQRAVPGAEGRGAAILNMALDPNVSSNLSLLDELIRLQAIQSGRNASMRGLTGASTGAGAGSATGLLPLLQSRQ